MSDAIAVPSAAPRPSSSSGSGSTPRTAPVEHLNTGCPSKHWLTCWPRRSIGNGLTSRIGPGEPTDSVLAAVQVSGVGVGYGYLRAMAKGGTDVPALWDR